MKDLNAHYLLLLGLDSSWQVANVNRSLEEKRVVIELKHVGKEVVFPDCKSQCKIADHAPVRQWRHLDKMQFETRIRAKASRSSCGQCGVKTISVPWAGKHSRFTLMFVAFAIAAGLQQRLQSGNGSSTRLTLGSCDHGARC